MPLPPVCPPPLIAWLLLSLLPGAAAARPPMPTHGGHRGSIPVDSGLRIDKEAETRRRLTVRVLQNSLAPLGSGVILSRSQGGYWIATNRHVVEGHQALCVQTSDGSLYSGRAADPKLIHGLDLIYVWFPSDKDYAVGKDLLLRGNLPRLPQKVVATGYTIGGDGDAQSAFVARWGLSFPLLSGPIEGGLQLTYTSDIDKGMSGGPVFLSSNRILGINSWHSDPLWDSPASDRQGRPLSLPMNIVLSRVAVGIPAATISGGMVGLKIPASAPSGRCR